MTKKHYVKPMLLKSTVTLQAVTAQQITGPKPG